MAVSTVLAMKKNWRVALVLLVVVVACKAPPSSTTDFSCLDTIPIAPVKTDILLVVDNSCSMTDKQDLLATGLATFANRLANATIQQDFQVGVITTSVIQQVQNSPQFDIDYSQAGWWGPAQAGRLQQAVRMDGSSTPKILRYDDATFLADFQLAVKVGVSGSAEETEFEPVRLALSSPLIDTPLDQGGNQGLLRAGARLLVFTITDEDDCSEVVNSNGILGYAVWIGDDKYNVDYCYQMAGLLTTPGDYANIFLQLAAAQGSTEVFFAAIAPVDVAPPHLAIANPNSPTLQAQGCPISFGIGRRLRQMAYLYDPSGQNLDSICAASYSDTLSRLADQISAPQTLELALPPPDGRMLVVDIIRADGTAIECTDGNGFVYAPPANGLPARLSFVDPCGRRADDKKIDVKLICAR